MPCHEDADFSALIRRYYPGLLRQAQRICRAGDIDPEDLVQEVVERAILNRDRLSASLEPEVRAWLCTTLVNLFRDRYRRCRVERVRNEAWATERDEAAAAPEPERMRWELISENLFRRVVGQLSPKLLGVLQLKLQGKSHQEISGTLGIPMGTVASRLSNARERLRALLKEWIVRDEQAGEYRRAFVLWE